MLESKFCQTFVKLLQLFSKRTFKSLNCCHLYSTDNINTKQE